MRLKDKVAIVVGAGQNPGEGMGNGRATAVLFAREGARVLCVDRTSEAAEETVAVIAGEGNEAAACVADVTDTASLHAMAKDCVDRWGSIDVLHNNVGISVAGGDAELDKLTDEIFDNIVRVNLRGTIMACQAVEPIMHAQKSGSIISISSVAARAIYPYVTYKVTKSAMIAFTEQLAVRGAPHGVRANCILPGLIDTPMAVDTRAREFNKPRAEVAAERDARVLLRNKMGSAWDVAHGALYLASDEASFVTGVALPIDGGALIQVRGG
ncbi:MAG: SDR family NAD(P)-dependent oxidoreductase [Alphaproteobacteria bacterium]